MHDARSAPIGRRSPVPTIPHRLSYPRRVPLQIERVPRYCGLLPVPLLDGTYYYQQCYVNPHLSDTFISAQAIIDSSDGLFDHWQLDGYSSGRPGSLAIYSPSGLLKISIPLVFQEGLYYCETDTFTVATNPRSIALTKRTCKLDFKHHILHLVEDDESTDDDDDNGEPTLDDNDGDDGEPTLDDSLQLTGPPSSRRSCTRYHTGRYPIRHPQNTSSVKDHAPPH